MSVRFVELNGFRADDWEQLNEQSAEGTLFHTLRWKRLLEGSFSFVTRYRMIYRGNKAVVLCPLFASRFFGFRGLMALPDDTLNPCDHLVSSKGEASLDESIRALQDMARMEGLSFLVLGVSEAQRSALAGADLTPRAISGRMVLDLTKNPPAHIWRERLSNNQRNKIRRFDKEGFTLDYVTSREDIATFHFHYAANLQRFNARPYPMSFFEKLVSAYSGKSSDKVMLTLLRKGECIAGGILALYWDARKIMYWRYFALNRSLPNRYTPFYHLLWHAIKDAHEMGCRTFDLGGVGPDPRNAHFKMKERFGGCYVPRYRLILPLSHLAKLLFALKTKTNSLFNASRAMCR